jgi:aryl-alcohol dehydrogenase-like predicted oxidoreductase
MLKRALQDEVWDVVMVGFNMLNQSARDRVLAETRRKNIGVLCMFAVRDALSRPEKLRETMDALVQQGLIDTAIINGQEPMAFLKGVAGDAGLPDLAYRFCRAEPGIHVVLSGTGNVQHLEQNAASILRPPLPEAVRQKLMELFARVDTVSGQ